LNKYSTVLSVSNLEKSFGNVQALNSLSLNVEPGIFGLIGPNGAGKTTLLRIILGLAKPDNGSVHLLGKEITSDSLAIRKQVGVLHEKPYFPPSLSARTYLERVRRIYGSDCSIQDLLSTVGLADVGERKIGHLSAGMYQKLGLAQALVGNPRLVLLDEPTSNLDVGGRDAIVDLIVRSWKESGVSFFIASHILSELERACTHVAFITSGRIVDEGSITELAEKHTANRFEVVTSDPERFLEVVTRTEGVVDAFVLGIASVIVEMTPSMAADAEVRLQEVASKSGVQILKVGKTGTLEDVYRKVSRSE
jgi:ABC-type multidrug transport system ATPase subunit